jgi:integrase
MSIPQMSQAAASDHKPRLWELTVQATTLKRYRRAYKHFLDWMDENGEDPISIPEYDEALAAFIQDLYDNGESLETAKCALLASAIYVPRAKGRLFSAQLNLKAWSKQQEVRQYPPVSWELAVAIAYDLCSTVGFHFAVATLLAFDSFLRVGELCAIKIADVGDADDPRLGHFGQVTIALRKTKTGVNQSVVVEDKQVVDLLRHHLSFRKRSCAAASATVADASLFQFSADVFRKAFKASCSRLGLSPYYVPHSLRHGGATHWFRSGKSIEHIMQRGRWRSRKSADRYIQSGRALLLSQQVPDGVIARVHTVKGSLLIAFLLKSALSQENT